MRKRYFIIPLCLVLIAAYTLNGAAKSLQPYSPPISYEIHTLSEAEDIAAEDFVPDWDDVLDARERCLKGLSAEQVSELKSTVINANLYWENGYMNNNIFARLEDPDCLEWNIYDPELTGEILIGWALPSDLDMTVVCAEENLSEDEFYEKYGTKVVTDQHYNTAGFIEAMENFSAAVSNEAMKSDLQYLADEMRLAVENHSMAHANNMYKMLHDMDYFLLRYGPEDMKPYVPSRGFVSKYFGTLSVYH